LERALAAGKEACPAIKLSVKSDPIIRCYLLKGKDNIQR
jgi:hypothetical protein